MPTEISYDYLIYLKVRSFRLAAFVVKFNSSDWLTDLTKFCGNI